MAFGKTRDDRGHCNGVFALLTSLAVITGIMILLWLVSIALGDVSIIDPFWGTGFVIVTAIACWRSAPLDARAWLVLTLTTIWGLRLSIYLLWRNWGHGEDRRYSAMRKKHGRRFWWLSLFTVFLLQGAILFFISLPLQVTVALYRRNSLSWLDAAGTLLWVIGFIFESVGDWQLARFQLDRANAGRVMDRGLWRVHASSELLRRLLRLVGALPDRGGRGGVVDCALPDRDVGSPLEGFGSGPARKHDHRPPARICRLQGWHERIFSGAAKSRLKTAPGYGSC